jgi:hypothetical protein
MLLSSLLLLLLLLLLLSSLLLVLSSSPCDWLLLLLPDPGLLVRLASLPACLLVPQGEGASPSSSLIVMIISSPTSLGPRYSSVTTWVSVACSVLLLRVVVVLLFSLLPSKVPGGLAGSRLPF